MTMIHQARCALVIAPHPDDEVLGCGGTMARLAAAGCAVHVAVLTRGHAPRFDPADVERVRAEGEAAHRLLDVRATHWEDHPAAALDTIPHATLNAAIAAIIGEIAPDTLFLPFAGDIHLDHQLVFQSALVAARPSSAAYPIRIYAYETLSETNWNAPGIAPAFCPNMFIDIAGQLEAKLAAFACYRSQTRAFPSERSPEALSALARLRGATVHRHAAEAFMLIREVG